VLCELQTPKNFLQLRQQTTGIILAEFPIEKCVFKQEKADLVVMHLEDEEEFLRTIKLNDQFGEISGLELYDDIITERNQPLEIVGHDFTKNDSGEEVMIPVTLPGKINLFSNNKYFIRTPEVAVMGLCGGPVLLLQENTAPKCIGMVEALVAPQQQSSNLQELKVIHNNTMVVPSTEIKLFIDELEKHESDEDELPITRLNRKFLDSL